MQCVIENLLQFLIDACIANSNNQVVDVWQYIFHEISEFSDF